MKKTALIFIALSFFFLFSPPLTLAAENLPLEVKSFFLEAIWQGEKKQFWDWGESQLETRDVLAEMTPETDLLPQPRGFLPGHPFYFLKRLREDFGLVFNFDPVTKEEKRLEIAQERLAEVNRLLAEGKLDLAQEIMADYVDQIGQITQTLKTKLAEEKKKILAQKLEAIAARHELVLEDVLEMVPETAKPAIEKAIKVSQRGMDVAADALAKPSVPPDFKTRLEALKKQALITPEEALTIINSQSREEVRKKIRQLLKEGKVPEADFKLLDEAQKFVLPEEFEKIREFKKLEELKRLKLQEVKKRERRGEIVGEQVEDFLKDYEPGEPVPPQLAPYLPLQRLEELKETIRPEVLIGEEIEKQDLVGPGGCYNEETCRVYCSQSAHRQECLQFLEMAPDWVKEKAKPPKSKLGPGGCRKREECEAFCRDPAHKDECEKFAPPFGREKKRPEESPRGCQTEEECEAFCRDPAHREECFSAWQQYGFPEGTPEFERRGPWEGRSEKGPQPEVSFPLEVSPPPREEMRREDFQEFKREMLEREMFKEEVKKVKGWFDAGNKGPAGCDGILSCFLYCSHSSNWQECRQWLK